MGNLLPFSNQRHQLVKKNDLFILHAMENSPIRGKMRIMDNETHALMRVLHDERKVVENLLKEASMKQNNKEKEYWNVILKTLNGILTKFKKILPVQEVMEDLTFAEMDCLIGVVEEYLHEHFLEDMQMIEDSTPLITKALSSFYETALPVYESKRLEFDGKQNRSE